MSESTHFALAPATQRAYDADWADFVGWADRQGLPSEAPSPETVGWYLVDLASRSPISINTVERRLRAISHVSRQHRWYDATWSPFVRTTLEGVRGALAKGRRRAAPLTPERLRRLLAVVPDRGKQGVRDRAVLLLGAATGLQAQELVDLEVDGLTFGEDGTLAITARRRRSGDVERFLVRPAEEPALCTVRAVAEWLALARIRSGPVFRSIDRHGHVRDAISPCSLNRIVQRYAEKAGLAKVPPGHPAPRFSTQSLRAGYRESRRSAR